MDIEGKRYTQRFHFREYKPVPFSFSFQIFSPCTLRHLVHTEHYKKNARRQASSHRFSPHTSEHAKTLWCWNWPSLSACKVFGNYLLYPLLWLSFNSTHGPARDFPLRVQQLAPNLLGKALGDCTISHLPHRKVLEIRTLCQTFLRSTSLHPVPHSSGHETSNRFLEFSETVCSDSMQRAYPRTEGNAKALGS